MIYLNIYKTIIQQIFTADQENATINHNFITAELADMNIT